MVFLTDSKRENCGILCLSVIGVRKKLAASCYETYPNKLYIIGKGNLSKSPIHFRY